ncbi:biotin--[acetyl-CoA-carboxylase] ligase [Proteinivorax hydrogeniformans]|uniref:Biotin--[acetyl-CoA-carboxylase] ligase n=1 Tax=Proteinivorax hydrogeniformans TaxID=1826727 RepID=A0AAU8HVI0_9FIRM
MLGKKIINLKAVDSTNSYAQKLAKQRYPEGTVVFAESQTKGRGRLGKSWLSLEEKGLYMSVIFRPPYKAAKTQLITPLTAAAVCSALRDFKLDAMIKWPNDIYISEKKVCGILSEISLKANKPSYVIVGIGINLNHKKDDFPIDLQHKSTSIRAEMGCPIDKQEVVKNLLFYLNMFYEEFIVKGNINSSISVCNKYSLLKGKIINVKNKEHIITGLAGEITSNGSLMIKDKVGTVKDVITGEVIKF